LHFSALKQRFVDVAEVGFAVVVFGAVQQLRRFEGGGLDGADIVKS